MAANTDFQPIRIWAPTVGEGGVFEEHPSVMYVRLNADTPLEAFPLSQLERVAVVSRTSVKGLLALTPREGGMPKNTLATIMKALREHYGSKTIDRLLTEEYNNQMKV